MKTNRKAHSDMQAGKAAAAGTVIAMGITLAATAAIALLVENERIAESGVSTYVIFIQFISAFIGSWIVDKLSGKSAPITSVIAAGLFCAILVLLTVLFYEGRFQNLLRSAATIAAGAVAAILLNLQSAKRKSVSRRKIRSR